MVTYCHTWLFDGDNVQLFAYSRFNPIVGCEYVNVYVCVGSGAVSIHFNRITRYLKKKKKKSELAISQMRMGKLKMKFGEKISFLNGVEVNGRHTQVWGRLLVDSWWTKTQQQNTENIKHLANWSSNVHNVHFNRAVSGPMVADGNNWERDDNASSG